MLKQDYIYKINAVHTHYYLPQMCAPIFIAVMHIIYMRNEPSYLVPSQHYLVPMIMQYSYKNFPIKSSISLCSIVMSDYPVPR